MIVFRAMFALYSAGCLALLIVLWASYGVPTTPDEWASCIISNMLILMSATVTGAIATDRELWN